MEAEEESGREAEYAAVRKNCAECFDSARSCLYVESRAIKLLRNGAACVQHQKAMLDKTWKAAQ